MNVLTFLKSLAKIEAEYAPWFRRTPELLALKYAASEKPNNLKDVELFFHCFNDIREIDQYNNLAASAQKLASKWMSLKEDDDYSFEVFHILTQDWYKKMHPDSMDREAMLELLGCAELTKWRWWWKCIINLTSQISFIC